jgi:hypothetical protein
VVVVVVVLDSLEDLVVAAIMNGQPLELPINLPKLKEV